MTKFERKKLNTGDGYLGVVDLSGTISTNQYSVNKDEFPYTFETNETQEERLEIPETQPHEVEDERLDLSQTQKHEVIIQDPQIIHVIPKWVKPLVMSALFITLFGTVFFLNQASSDTTPEQVERVAVAKTHQEDQGKTKTFTADLKKTADSTGTPYTVSTEVVGGGYVLGVTTYNPDKATEMYMDYALSKPESPQTKLEDERAKEIESDLSKDLPAINKSIIVKDPTKVMMETYKFEDKYHTILLYDGKPFAYVATDKDNIHTNYVTSYYVTDVAAQ